MKRRCSDRPVVGAMPADELVPEISSPITRVERNGALQAAAGPAAAAGRDLDQ
jgi:hypothetical protein